LDWLNSLEDKISLSPIISRWAFGISKPITGLPGITSTIRTLSTKFLLDKVSQFYWWRKPGLSGENHRPVGSKLKICIYLSTA
jgi:hypothetical protein